MSAGASSNIPEAVVTAPASSSVDKAPAIRGMQVRDNLYKRAFSHQMYKILPVS